MQILAKAGTLPVGSIVLLTEEDGSRKSAVRYRIQDHLELKDGSGSKQTVMHPKPNSFRWLVSEADGCAIHSIQKFKKVRCDLDDDTAEKVYKLLEVDAE